MSDFQTYKRMLIAKDPAYKHFRDIDLMSGYEEWIRSQPTSSTTNVTILAPGEQFCPHCGSAARRDATDGASTATDYAMGGVLLGAPLAYLRRTFTRYRCSNCGKIPLREFPAEVRSSILQARLASIFIFIGCMIIAGLILGAMSSR